MREKKATVSNIVFERVAGLLVRCQMCEQGQPDLEGVEQNSQSASEGGNRTAGQLQRVGNRRAHALPDAVIGCKAACADYMEERGGGGVKWNSRLFCKGGTIEQQPIEWWGVG
jgi:hypothetical protein